MVLLAELDHILSTSKASQCKNCTTTSSRTPLARFLSRNQSSKQHAFINMAALTECVPRALELVMSPEAASAHKANFYIDGSPLRNAIARHVDHYDVAEQQCDI